MTRKPRRWDAFNGSLGVGWDEDNYGDAFQHVCEPQFSQLRGRVKKLGMRLNWRTMGGGFGNGFWQDVPTLFPNLEQFNIIYGVTKHVHVDGDSNSETPEWKRLCEGRSSDSEFAYPAELLHLQDLAKYMENAGQICDIHMTVEVTWMDNRYHARSWDVSAIYPSSRLLTDMICRL